MNEQPLKQVADDQVETRQSVSESYQAALFDTLTDTLAQIQAIESSDGSSITASDRKLVAENLGVDPTHSEAVRTTLEAYEERQAMLRKQQTEARARLSIRVREAFLALSTALVLQGTPAVATEKNQTERSSGTAPTAELVQAESQELKREQVFDLHSPLAIVGEKMRELQRTLLPEEIALLKGLHEKAWNDYREWSVTSGRDRRGKFITKTEQLGEFGGQPDIYEFLQKIHAYKSSTHTHPRTAGFGFIGDREGALKGRMRMLPPSGNDIALCAYGVDQQMITRVVDPHGVWEFRCDTNDPKAPRNPNMFLAKHIQKISLTQQLSWRDHRRLQQSLDEVMSVTDPTQKPPAFGKLIGELNVVYPGLEDNVDRALQEYADEKVRLAKIASEYEALAFQFTRSFLENLDKTVVANNLREFIRGAEHLGIALSYTPFQELPVTK